MKDSETFARDEVIPFVRSIKGLGIDGLIARFGAPTALQGPRGEVRSAPGWSETRKYRRDLDFAGVGPRAYTLRVSERTDGTLDFSLLPPEGASARRREAS